MALTETQQTKASVKINHVPTDADVQTLFNNGSFNPGEIIVTPDEDVNLDCLRTKTLWTNPNPTSQFDNVSINLEENNCDYFEIRFRYNTTYNIVASVKIPAITGQATLLSMVNTPVILYVRKATVTSKTIIKFDSSYYGTTGSESVDNTTIIPIEVIGYIKTPAMIYTGKELNAGSGITLTNGTISSYYGDSEIIWSGSINSATSNITLTKSITNFRYLILWCFDSFNNWDPVITSVSSFKTLVNRSQPIGISNSNSDTNRYAEIYYVNDTTLGILNPVNMSFNYVEGIK